MTSETFGAAVRTRVLVREIMNSPLVSATPSTSVVQLSEKMVAAKAGSVVILQENEDDNSPLGIVTERDIVTKVVSKGLSPTSILAKDIMSSPLRTIEAEKEITEAARAMRRLGVKRLGVVYKSRLVGMISLTDILRVTPELFDIISEKTSLITGETTRAPTFLAGYCDVCNQWSDKLTEVDSKFVCNECTSSDGAERGGSEDYLEGESSSRATS